MVRFVINMLQIFGVVFLRFRWLPRLWCVWLVGANLACLYFISEPEAQVVLAVTVVAVLAQTIIYGRIGFVRILGVTHVLWVPMFVWLALRSDVVQRDPLLFRWLVLLFVTNLVSAVVDAVDAVRFLRGERAPHYRWKAA